MKMKSGAKKLFAMMMMVVLLIASATVANASTNVTVGGDNINKQLAYAPPKTAVKITAEKGVNNYLEGDDFSKTNLIVKVIYSDNSSDLLATNKYDVSPASKLKYGTTSVTIAYKKDKKIFTNYNIVVHSAIVSISATGAKNVYTEGELFDPSGLLVNTFDKRGTKKTISTDYSITPQRALTVADKFVTVSYRDLKVDYPITVNPKLLNLTISKAKLEYTEGEKFDTANLVINANYSDGTAKEVKDYKIDPAGALKTTDKTVTISWGGVSTRSEITVKEIPKLIMVTISKAKLEYTEGEKFDTTNLVINANYSDGTTKEVKDYKIDPAGALKTTDKIVTISYGGISARSEITVKAIPKLIMVTISKAKLEYTEGEKFDTANLVVNANYSDGTAKEVKDYRIDPTRALMTTDKTVTISYGGLSVVCQIIVKAIPKLTTITAVNARTVYTEGESFDPTGMLLIAKYSDNSEKEITKGWTINPSGQLNVNNKYVEIRYQGISTQYPIKVNEKNRLVGITVANAKTVYTEGEAFDTSNLQVKAKYSNNTEETVTDYSVTPNGPLTSANKTVRVSYGGYSKDIAITVNAAKLTLTVINGSGSGAFGMNAKVLISPTLKKGQYFAGWKMENGKILTQMEVYYFLLTRSMTLEAVVSDKKPTATPVAALDQSYTVTRSNGTWKATILGTFTNTSYWNFFSRTGFVTVNEKSYTGGEITLNTKDAVDVDATYSMNAAGQVYRAIHTQNTGRFYVRAYTIYMDETWHFKTIYSDETVLVDIK